MAGWVGSKELSCFEWTSIIEWRDPLRLSTSVAAGFVLMILACDRPMPTEPPLPICAAGTAVSVGAGVQPVISWNSRCRVSEVRVEAYPVSGSGPFEGAWQAYSLTDDVVSPVQVGVPRADGSHGPGLTLIPGRVYRACLGTWDEEALQTVDLGCQTFQP